MSPATTTGGHARIRKWVEDRERRLAKFRAPGSIGGIRRIDFSQPEAERTGHVR
jgi:hypothetical protein